ncbi:MAG: hypothetical protein WCZ18_00055 [Ottowia sp.]|nr:hypothetical protein [Ottowia sp.]
MTPVLFLLTAILLGLFMLCGGAWALLYCLGQTRGSKMIMRAGLASYALAVILALTIALATPLQLKWKVLIMVSGLAYAFIPPITLRYLERLHAAWEPHA